MQSAGSNRLRPHHPVQGLAVLQPLGGACGVVLARVEVACLVGLPQRVVAADQAILGKQQLGGAAPGAELKKTAVVPQVAYGLACVFQCEGELDLVQQFQPVAFAAAQGFEDVKGGAAVFGFFGGVPQPQGLQAWLGTL